jgi:hypothetical protein
MRCWLQKTQRLGQAYSGIKSGKIKCYGFMESEGKCFCQYAGSEKQSKKKTGERLAPDASSNEGLTI